MNGSFILYETQTDRTGFEYIKLGTPILAWVRVGIFIEYYV